MYLLFLHTKTKGKFLRGVVLFLPKKTNKGEMGNLERRICNVYLEKIKKGTNIFETSQRLV